jgi:hypothetical protein
MMMSPSWMLLWLAAIALLMPGKARAADLDPIQRGQWLPSVPGWTQAVAVEGNLVLAAIGQGGLAIIDATDPSNPQHVGSFETSGYAYGVAVAGSHA